MGVSTNEDVGVSTICFSTICFCGDLFLVGETLDGTEILSVSVGSLGIDRLLKQDK